MKRMTVLTACILLASSHAVAADLTNDESTQLQPREEATIHYQARLDPDGTPALLQAMQRYQFKHENTTRVRSMIQDAKQQGLPTAPLMSKVYEGIAKKANEDNIVQAVKRVQSRYEHAYRQASTLSIDKQQAKQLGQIMADAYTAGLKEEDGTQIMTQLQTRTRTTNQEEANELMVQTMVTARIMARMGVDSTTASAVLVNALQSSYQAREMHTLQNSFIEQARYGSPEDIAREFSADINKGAAASELGSQSNTSGAINAGSRSGGSSDSGGSSSGSSGGSSGSGGSGGSSGSGGSGSSGGSGGSGGSGSSGGAGGSSGAGGSGGAGGAGGSSGAGGR